MQLCMGWQPASAVPTAINTLDETQFAFNTGCLCKGKFYAVRERLKTLDLGRILPNESGGLVPPDRKGTSGFGHSRGGLLWTEGAT
jgi:hypothetical protein